MMDMITNDASFAQKIHSNTKRFREGMAKVRQRGMRGWRRGSCCLCAWIKEVALSARVARPKGHGAVQGRGSLSQVCGAPWPSYLPLFCSQNGFTVGGDPSHPICPIMLGEARLASLVSCVAPLCMCV